MLKHYCDAIDCDQEILDSDVSAHITFRTSIPNTEYKDDEVTNYPARQTVKTIQLCEVHYRYVLDNIECITIDAPQID